jgi:hypothetical protein
MAEKMGKHFVLVGEFPAALEHRLLVERREGDAFDLAGLCKIDGARERVAGELAGSRRPCSICRGR